MRMCAQQCVTEAHVQRDWDPILQYLEGDRAADIVHESGHGNSPDSKSKAGKMPHDILSPSQLPRRKRNFMEARCHPRTIGVAREH
jgi:hypothetical protein